MRLLAFLSLLLVLGAGNEAVRAHDWFDPWCCNLSDCRPIPDHAVKVTPQGYVITLHPHEHQMLKNKTGPRTYTVPFGDARISLDPEQRFFACIWPTPETMR